MRIIDKTYEEVKDLGQHYLRKNYFNKRSLKYNEFISSSFDDFLIFMHSSRINNYFNQIKFLRPIYKLHNFKCASFDKDLNQLQDEILISNHKAVYIPSEIHLGLYQYYDYDGSLIRLIVNQDIVIVYIMHFNKEYIYDVKSIYYTMPLDLVKNKWICFIKDDKSVVGKTFNYKIEVKERGDINE